MSGKYTRENCTGNNGRLDSFDYLSLLSIDREVGFKVVDKLKEISVAHEGVTPAQVAMAWLMAKTYVSSVIIGVSKLEQLSDNISAAELLLNEEELKTLDEITMPKPLYPYKWRASSGDPVVRKMLID